MQRLDFLFIGAVMNYDGTTGSYANYIRQGRKWVAPFQYIHQKRPEHFKDEAHACVYGVPNLSLCKLADYMKRNLDEVDFHIIWHFDYHKEEALEILQKRVPRLVAISTTLAFYPKFLNGAIEWINRHKRPETKVVIGGKWIFDQQKLHGLSRRLEQTLIEIDTDYAIINGYGEETLRQLLLAERAGDSRRAQSLLNLAYRTRDAVVDPTDQVAMIGLKASSCCGSHAHEEKDGCNGENGHSHANGAGQGSTNGKNGLPLSVMGAVDPLLAYAGDAYCMNRVEQEDHIPGKPMIDFQNVGLEFLGDTVHVRTCSSCPFKCKFCTFPVLQGDHVLFDIPDIIVQLKQLKDMGVKSLFFIDDTFNVPRDRFEVLMDEMIKADLGMQWVSFYRAQFANEKIVTKMYEAGCRMVFCGFESGNDHILKLMAKTVTVQKYYEGLEWLNRFDIASLASYIIGYPGETYETCMDTLKLIDDPRVTFSRGSLFYYDPNAPVGQIAKEWELEGFGNDWKHKTMTSEEAARIHLEMLSKLKGINTPVSDGGAWSLFNLYARGLSWDDIKKLYREFNDIQKRQVEAAGAAALRQYRARANESRLTQEEGHVSAEAIKARIMADQESAIADF